MKKLILLFAFPFLLSACATAPSSEIESNDTQEVAQEAKEEDKKAQMIVTLTNVGSEVLSPGVFITHDKKNVFKVKGDQIEAALNELRVNKETGALSTYAGGLKTKDTLFKMPIELAPGDDYSFQVATSNEPKYLSGVHATDIASVAALNLPFEPGTHMVDEVLEVKMAWRNY